ncbi:unnamed protein product [Rotaria socialis]|uniref:Uncharacterized protein n=1 Tax=Rotaria socialis TaxID=392032 RepID=A0A820WZW6_9BILA|nr:unnamed protein product [Rotaria socialis]CAF4524478.1 unnamed protein product [Rotaria socialis]
MTNQLHLTGLLQAITRTLNTFNIQAGSALIERALVNVNDDPNNTQLLANLKQELDQLPPLANLNMHEEMLWFFRTIIDYVYAANVIDKRLVTRAIEKLNRGLEPFARNDEQRTTLLEMQIAKDDALDVEPRHRIGNKPNKQCVIDATYEKDEDLHMTRELKLTGY